MKQIIVPQRGLILPPRFDERDYERSRIERLPLRRKPSLQAASSIVGAPFHQYVATSGTAYNTSIALSANDILILFASDGNVAPSGPVVTGATCTLAQQLSQSCAGSAIGVAWTGLVTGAGTATITVNGGNGDTGWTAIGLRGCSSATPHQKGSAAPSVNAASYTVPLTTTVICSLLTFWANESIDCMTGVLPAGSTQINHDAGHFDGAGYKLDQAAGTYNIGISANSTGATNSVVLALAMTTATGGGFTAVNRRSIGPRVGSRSYS